MLAEFQRLGGGQRNIADQIGAGDVEVSLSRFFQKRTGAGRTGLIHGVIDRHLVFE